MKFSTRAIHAGQHADETTGAIMTPVYFTSTFVQPEPGKHKGYDYARTNHPTRKALEENIASLEDGKFGICFSSGLAAETAAIMLLSSGDHIISTQDLYGGTYRLLTKVFDRLNIKTTFVDGTRHEEVEKAVQPNTKMLWLESPTNPLLTVVDLQRLSELGHKKGLTVVVDNTFASPFLQQPLKLGADVVAHSSTKYLGGHSDVVGGALVTNSQEIFDKLKFVQNAIGGIPGPMDCFLVLRGTKTLAVRMERHCQNAKNIAIFLKNHPEVERVMYPGLQDHPGHEIARKQMCDFGGMISVVFKGGLERNKKFITSLKIFSLAESLGGVESLVSLSAAMTHASMPQTYRDKVGIPDSLVRLSVGIEDCEDLIDDIRQAIEKSST